jgi:ATP-dependent helicase/nuclease subunit A
MVRGGVFAPQEAAAIDPAAAAWFFAAPLGARLREKKTRVYREWPFVMGVDPRRYDAQAAGSDARDIMLVRGIIDGLFDAGEGWEILDYKTDAVAGEELRARAAEYAGQLRIYAAAAEAVWGKAVRRGWLVFLAARQVVEVECGAQ